MASKDETDESLSPIQHIEAVIKDKIFNKIFAYVFFSFLVINWQEIIILAKSKNDIYYTLAILFTSKEFLWWIIPAWLAHFGLPFVFGVIASIITPYLTYSISKYTSLPLARMRYIDREADIRVKSELQNLRAELSKATIDANNMEHKVKSLNDEFVRLSTLTNDLKDHRIRLFKGIEAFVLCYDKKGMIKDKNDLIEFILEVENTEFYKDQAIANKVNKMVENIKDVYYKEEGASE
ncbi:MULTISPECIES: hypothetical protein [Pectobacterium]|uniref:hypothetical protein n=1 Tax=Pectobacterium TaxID=122277 RepID=UPI000C7EE0CA|nr:MULTISPECIES: hypothetical protein [Pectobacterium]MBQ4778709.1 hypothetical protein [Pectobacterium versatile]PLY37547.1 hypothetical protein F164LOC_09700 [Pectobacterium carotovorum]UAY90691.1 hypothetical protein KSL88_14280 [Pectobacterium polaris]